MYKHYTQLHDHLVKAQLMQSNGMSTSHYMYFTSNSSTHHFIKLKYHKYVVGWVGCVGGGGGCGAGAPGTDGGGQFVLGF